MSKQLTISSILATAAMASLALLSSLHDAAPQERSLAQVAAPVQVEASL